MIECNWQCTSESTGKSACEHLGKLGACNEVYLAVLLNAV